MSNVYVQEPATNGKVLLHTTAGDIDIELWSKEAPKTCRNFVQLCMEGYYNETIFHRVEKNFIIQGGDPTGTGFGGESIYGETFKSEFHSRLRFSRRGLIGMANSGKNDNSTQFFFTLGPTPELDKKNTLFAKITGNTLFNMIKISEDVQYCEGEFNRPKYPYKITGAQILSNPFDDIIPRKNEKIETTSNLTTKVKVIKNKNLLSFQDDEEEEIEIKGCKSSHDILKDPKLSSKTVDVTKIGAKRSKYSEVAHQDQELIDNTAKKQKRSDIKNLQKEIIAKRRVEIDSTQNAEPAMVDKMNILENKEKFRYKFKSTNIRSRNPRERESDTMGMLSNFKSLLKMNSALSTYTGNIDSDDEDAGKVKGDDMTWLKHSLTYQQVEDKALNANVYEPERYHLNDPRHPTNKHRRGDYNKSL